MKSFYSLPLLQQLVSKLNATRTTMELNLDLDLDIDLPILDYLDSYFSLYKFIGESNTLFLITTRMMLDLTTTQNNKIRNIINTAWKFLEIIIDYSDLYTALGLLLGESNCLFLLTTRIMFDYKKIKNIMQKLPDVQPVETPEEPKTMFYPKILYKKLDNQNKSKIPHDRMLVYKKVCNKPRMNNIQFNLKFHDKKPNDTKNDTNNTYSIFYGSVVLCSSFMFFGKPTYIIINKKFIYLILRHSV